MFLYKWVHLWLLCRGCLTGGRRFLDESVHPVDNRFWGLLRFNNYFPIFFVDFNLGPFIDSEGLSHVFRKDDSPF